MSRVRLTPEAGMGLFGGVFALAMLLPSLAVSVRRLPRYRSQRMVAAHCVCPLIGGIVLLIFAVQDGTPGDNRFGSNPKAAVA